MTSDRNDLQSRDYFGLLPRDQQIQAIRRLAAVHGDHVIAEATGLSVDYVRRLLAGDAIGSVEGGNR